MNWPKQQVTDSLDDSGDGNQLRAEQAWVLIGVSHTCWLFFAIYYWVLGYALASSIGFLELIAQFVVILAFRKSKRFRLIAVASMACSILGILLISWSAPVLSNSMFFVPLSIVVSSHAFGIRQAFVWLVATICTFFLFYAILFEGNMLERGNREELVLALGVAICTFYCCQQGEEHYQRRTNGLLRLSRLLKEKSDELQVLATTDSLTQLTNRYQFQNEIEMQTAEATEQKKLALFLIDMDGFKEVNDTLGHAIGDEILTEIGHRLRAAFGQLGSVARLGGDEFCILQPNVEDPRQVDETGHRIFRVLTEEYKTSESTVRLGTSVGFALCPDNATTAKDLLSFADTAMYQAKETNSELCGYSRAMTDSLRENRLFREELANSLQRNQFFLEYQPQVNVGTDEIVGVEALLRWKNAGKVIPPGRFIPLLEQTHEIIPVGKWVIRRACQQLAEWLQQGYDLKIAVNVSALQFKDPDFCKSVAAPLRAFAIPPEKLELEITEGMLVEDVEEVTQKLNNLKDLGVQVSIDDFGTGYSSLAYLRQFPIDRLKIDRTFIKGIPNEDDGRIATSIIVLADSLELQVTAEGVETAEQLGFLRQPGAEMDYQGFYFSPPVSAETVEKLLLNRIPV